MTDTPKIAWKRLAIEAPVIVTSILLAFAIDAWWEERGKRRAEAVLLERLHADFIIASRVNAGPYTAAFGDVTRGIPGHVATPARREPLVIDDDFMNHVLDRFKWQQIALRDIAPVRTAVEEILALLQQELGT